MQTYKSHVCHLTTNKIVSLKIVSSTCWSIVNDCKNIVFSKYENSIEYCIVKNKKNSFCFQKQVLKSNFKYLSFAVFLDSTIGMLHVHCRFCVSYSAAQ